MCAQSSSKKAREDSGETGQLNMRLSKDLLEDLALISSILKVHASRLRNAGAISEEEFSSLASRLSIMNKGRT
jgi:hypothetical protein